MERYEKVDPDEIIRLLNQIIQNLQRKELLKFHDEEKLTDTSIA